MNTERTRHGGTRLAPRLAWAACVAGLLALLLVPGSPGDPAGTALAQDRPQRWRFAIYDPTLESILGRIWTGDEAKDDYTGEVTPVGGATSRLCRSLRSRQFAVPRRSRRCG